MMMVLADLKSLHILASPKSEVSRISLRNVVMTTTDYNLEIGAAPSIPGVEECICPEGGSFRQDFYFFVVIYAYNFFILFLSTYFSQTPDFCQDLN